MMGSHANRGRWLAASLALPLIAGGGSLVGREVWLTAKAGLASRLIDTALRAHLRDGRPHRPWRHADTWPIASLDVPRLDVRRVVLAGASGSSLAFGPGHVDGSAKPNAPGNCVIAGHRDGSFRFLDRLQPGDELRLRGPGGAGTYRVRSLSVVNLREAEVLSATDEDRLTLVTCYPFRGLTESGLRYVVTAVRDVGDRRPIPDGTRTLRPGGTPEHDQGSPRDRPRK